MPCMDTIIRRSSRTLTAAVASVLLAALLAIGSTPALADDAPTAGSTVLAVGEHERRPIAPTQRDQLGLVLYGLMALAVLAGGATLRRQLRGDRPQSDGEFRWR